MLAELKKIVNEYCVTNDIKFILSFDMPLGYEKAYGTFDVCTNILHINLDLLKELERYEWLFYLFHELRHAKQYLKPTSFNIKIRNSLKYVILFNGNCYKLVENQWKSCVIEGDEKYFLCAYSNLPYEIDANNFAYLSVKSIIGNNEINKLKELYSFWKPIDKFSYSEYEKIFKLIDSATTE